MKADHGSYFVTMYKASRPHKERKRKRTKTSKDKKRKRHKFLKDCLWTIMTTQLCY